MHNSIGKALCIKDRTFGTDEDRGIVRILFTENDGIYEPYNPDTIAEDGVFIIHSYESGTSQFQDDEIFCLNSYRESDKDDWKEGSGYKKRYVSDGHEISPLNKYEMILLLEASLPDKKNGILSTSSTPPLGKLFFIHENDIIYGPFLANRNGEDVYAVVPFSVPSLALDTDHILSIRYSDIANLLVTNLHDNRKYLQNINKLKEVFNASDKIDFISDKDLIKYFAKNGFGKNVKKLSKSAARVLLDATDKYAQQKNSYKSSERIERLKSIMEDYLSQHDLGQEIINDWANTKQGHIFLEKYVHENSSTILNERISKLEETAKQEIEKLKTRIKKHQNDYDVEKARLEGDLEKLRTDERQERKRITDDLEDYRQQTEKQKEETLQEQAAELKSTIEDLRKQISQKKTERDNLERELEQYKRGRELKQFIDLLEMQKDELSRTVEEKDALLKNPNELRKLAIQDKTLKQLLSLNLKPETDQKIEYTPVYCNPEPVTRPEDYIDTVRSYLDDQDGKTLSRDEIANLMICITQNYLTCLAGLPGGGKTSSIYRLAEAMGLHNPSISGLSNFLNISVGQGWAGTRDLLGYFNAIKGEFQAAPTKLYEFLQLLENASEKKHLRLVLLDEGNLSPLEHYWSDFLQMSDLEYRNKTLTLDSKDSNLTLRPGNLLRWVTTINSDETTERLSPRLLDRVPVIKMDPELDIESTLDYTVSEPSNIPGAIPWSTMEKWFNPTDDNDFSALDRQVIKSILDQNEKTRMLHLSQRKLKRMRYYLTSARKHMDVNQALDWCIAMYVLPTIEGYGSNIEKSLSFISSELDKNGLRQSLRIVETILVKGRMSQSFSYF